jgi:hypothetical protein
VRRHGGVKIMEITQGFNKVIRKLEMTERDIKLEIASLGRESKQERQQARSRALPAAAGGLAALVIGILLIFLPNRRVGA